MKNLRLIIVMFSINVVLLLHSCKKDKASQPDQPLTEGPITIADSTFVITGIFKIDINDVDISFNIKPPTADSFTNIYLHWSRDSIFSDGDSVLLSASIKTQLVTKYALKRLTQSTGYYSKLGILYKGNKFYSQIKNFTTETLSITKHPTFVNKGKNYPIETNFILKPGRDTSTRVYLDNVLCTVDVTSGSYNTFIVPGELMPKKYQLRFERNGINAIASDSVEVAAGVWSSLTPPSFPPVPGYEQAIGYYGSCYSSQKGYIVPGNYYRDYQYGDPNFGRPGYILEFDLLNYQWTRKYPTNPKYFDSPIAYYYNNAIYVIAGSQTNIYNGDHLRLKNVQKLDLATLTWSELAPVPHPNNNFHVSFELNNEWYIGLGPDLSVLGYPQPNKKFWKYNPATNVWTHLTDFPVDLSLTRATATFVINDDGYVFFSDLGSFGPRGKRQELWKFNTVSNTWAEVNLSSGELPYLNKYSIVSHSGKAYFFTGEKYIVSPFGNMAEVEGVYKEYDPVANKFKRFSSQSLPSILKPIGIVGDKFYFQDDALGQIEYIHNKTYEFKME